MTTLAIGHLRHVICSRLTTAEAFRLNIAEQLLKDSEIILCDDISKQMDVNEVAFVVDFLRDWAIKLNRAVIMAITPSSFDMLLMFSKCALLTAGSIVYFESTTKITQYFDSIGFPCPKFKNPCEFYVDMATHDHIFQAAAAESSARIEKLLECWEQSKPLQPTIPNTTALSIAYKPSVMAILIAFYRYSRYIFKVNTKYGARELSSLINKTFLSFSARPLHQFDVCSAPFSRIL
uniref:ABC2_membrane_7 domain-containing protein n=1 Tax=Angiostrongylus cantonensis TaxID=6313 RepID=A0A0K0CT15_ANGCA